MCSPGACLTRPVSEFVPPYLNARTAPLCGVPKTRHLHHTRQSLLFVVFGCFSVFPKAPDVKYKSRVVKFITPLIFQPEVDDGRTGTLEYTPRHAKGNTMASTSRVTNVFPDAGSTTPRYFPLALKWPALYCPVV